MTFLTIRAFIFSLLSCAILLAIYSVPCFAGKPEIANVHPDFTDSGNPPKIITGEGFDPASTRVWTWSPPSDEATIKKALANIDEGLPPLPAKPPEEAKSHKPIDVEPQVIVAQVSGAVMWVETADGFSKPLMFDVSKPCWLSESQATPGSMIYAFGFGLRPRYGKVKIAIIGEGQTFYPDRIAEARTLRTTDSRLVYFEVPREIKPGQYTVYMHNSIGGQWGWRKAGELEAVAAASEPDKIFDVREYGTKGDGLANDRGAIISAIEAAQKAGGGTVFFAPGTYLTDETISVPSGVKLRGASRKNCILQGFGDALKASRPKVWYIPFSPPASVVRLHNSTSIESLTVQGTVWKGKGGHGMIEAVAGENIRGHAQDVTIVDCCLRADEEDPRTRRYQYRSAFNAKNGSLRTKLLSNEIFGSTHFGYAVRVDIIGNTYHGGAVSDVVTLGGKFSQSLIDDNQFIDTPGRMCLGMGWHNYIRYNEIHQAFRSTWNNAEEVYLVHGGSKRNKTISFATGASADTLVDKRQNWKPGILQNAAVLVISGRGFGQYRRVIDNTKDTLTLEKPWNVEPDSTTEYVVSSMFVESAFFANLNNTPLRLSLWLDCVANLVEMHRDDHSKGMDLWGLDDSQVDENGIAKDLRKFYPAYYNMFVNNWMDGSALWLGIRGALPNNAHRGYPVFGNFATANRIRQPHTYRGGFNTNPHPTSGINVIGGSGRAGNSHTIVSNNFLGSTYKGIKVDEMARKTFVLRNIFDHVDEPIVDEGARTVLQGNRIAGSSHGDKGEAIPDKRSERDLPEWKPRPWKPAPAEIVPLP